MTDFLLILNNLSKFSKLDIDKGKTPLDVYRICSCIRNIFCLSYSIRKSNIFYLSILNNHLIVKFDGMKLRYLGPDERSQSLLLNKALSISDQREWTNQDYWLQSTPGIFIKKLPTNQNLVDFCNSLVKNSLIIFSNISLSIPRFLELTPKIIKQLERNLLIFTFNIDDSKIIKFSDQLSKSDNVISYKFPSIKTFEDKVLYINFQIDRFRDENNDT